MNIPTFRLKCNVCGEYIDAKGYRANIDVTCLTCLYHIVKDQLEELEK